MNTNNVDDGSGAWWIPGRVQHWEMDIFTQWFASVTNLFENTTTIQHLNMKILPTAFPVVGPQICNDFRLFRCDVCRVIVYTLPATVIELLLFLVFVLLFLPHWLWSLYLFLSIPVSLLAIRLPCFNKVELSWELKTHHFLKSLSRYFLHITVETDFQLH